jgi:Cation transport ATPase
MALNHDIQSNEEGDFMGEATELALVEHIVEDLGQKEYEQIQEKYPRVGEIPFDSERKRMSTFHQFEDHVLVICKGATETILDVLEKDISSEEIIKMSDQWASEGERVLAFAGKLIPSLPAEEEWENLEKDLSFWGLAGMIDPPREEVKEAIQECKNSGYSTCHDHWRSSRNCQNHC